MPSPTFRRSGSVLAVSFALSCVATSLAQPPLPLQVTPATVARVKAATVLLQVVGPDDSKAEGSGFFALKPGIIITNAHVLGMLGKNSVGPKSVDVILNSGEAKETKLQGTVLGVDRDSDLGILRVEGTGLPAPLDIETKRPLVETQKLYVFGFPFGAQLGRNITVAESSVSSLRTDSTGRIQQVQVNGGIHPGNSGGPLVNSEGKVVGVAVSIIRGTQIHFAVPADFVAGLPRGRVTDVTLGEAYVNKGSVSIPVKVTCLDPFGQIKEVRLDVWSGPPGQAPAESTLAPKARPGDGKRQTSKLVLTRSVGESDVAVPTIAGGQVCWLQPVIVTKDNQTQWAVALTPTEPLNPVERKKVKIEPNFEKEPVRTLKFKSVSGATLTRGKLVDVASDVVEVDALETIAIEEPNTFLRLVYGPTVDIVSQINGQTIKMHPETNKFFRAAVPAFILTPAASVKSRISRVLNPKMNAKLKDDYLGCFTQFCNSIEASMIPIPKRELEPLGKYTARVTLIVGSVPDPVAAAKGDGNRVAKTVDLALVCTYQGARIRNGREEALMTFVGQVKPRSKGTEKAKGDVVGKYAVDVEGGFASLVHIKVFSEIESPGGEIRLTSALVADADRRPGNPLNIQVPMPAPKK